MREGDKHKKPSEFLLLLSVREALCTLNSEEWHCQFPSPGTTLSISASSPLPLNCVSKVSMPEAVGVCACMRSVVSNSLGPHGLQPGRLLLSVEFSRQEYQRGLPFPSVIYLDLLCASLSKTCPKVTVPLFNVLGLGKFSQEHSTFRWGWRYISKENKITLEKISSHLCLLQHNSQQPRFENKLSVL